MAENLPYVTSVGTLRNLLNKIQTASIPERFTQDFVKTKLQMSGGSAMGTIKDGARVHGRNTNRFVQGVSKQNSIWHPNRESDEEALQATF